MKRQKKLQNKIKIDPFDYTFELIGKKFTIQILRNMLFEKQIRFNEFLNSINGINPRILSHRLKEMEKNGLIERIVFNDAPIKIEYQITTKGKNLKPLLVQMAKFSLRFYPDKIFTDKKHYRFNQLFGTEK